MYVKDDIARRYLEVFREEVADDEINFNKPWLDLDVEAHRAYGRGEIATMPGPTYTDGPVIRAASPRASPAPSGFHHK